MAIVKCKECGTDISSKAKSCPKCGAPIKKKTSLFTWLVTLLLIFWVIGQIPNNSDYVSSNAIVSETKNSPSTNTSPIQPEYPGSQWYYSQSEDAMGKGTNYIAVVLSSNTVNFDFPYSGNQYGKLMLRTHPRYGKDIIFSIEKGQILCNSYDGCNVLVRFDDEKGIMFSAAGSSDNSTETIFIHNYQNFVTKMLKAKRVRISPSIYQEGSPVFEFDVSDFDQNKYKPKKKT